MCRLDFRRSLGSAPRRGEGEERGLIFPIASIHQQVKDRTSDKTNKVKELRLLPERINLITTVLCTQCPFIHPSGDRPCVKAKFLV